MRKSVRAAKLKTHRLPAGWTRPQRAKAGLGAASIQTVGSGDVDARAKQAERSRVDMAARMWSRRRPSGKLEDPAQTLLCRSGRGRGAREPLAGPRCAVHE